jgi:hypothetical protein
VTITWLYLVTIFFDYHNNLCEIGGNLVNERISFKKMRVWWTYGSVALQNLLKRHLWVGKCTRDNKRLRSCWDSFSLRVQEYMEDNCSPRVFQHKLLILFLHNAMDSMMFLSILKLNKKRLRSSCFRFYKTSELLH